VCLCCCVVVGTIPGLSQYDTVAAAGSLSERALEHKAGVFFRVGYNDCSTINWKVFFLVGTRISVALVVVVVVVRRFLLLSLSLSLLLLLMLMLMLMLLLLLFDPLLAKVFSF